MSDADRAHLQAAVDALQKWYEPKTGLYQTTGWWNSANAITALANFSRVAHSTQYLAVFANSLHAAQQKPDGAPGFINDYYDDEGWWALAWIDVYDLTHDAKYLNAADSIFADMKLGWDTDTCGGGLWWSKKTREKNAIENELFLAVAASLANRESDPAKRTDDLAWAHKEWAWFSASGMINGDHLVNDGLNSADPKHCVNNGKNTWTYNQGVILGGLVELNRLAPDPALMRIANQIATAAISRLTDQGGVLRETSKAHTGGDVPQFKGIFARNLMIFDTAAPDCRFAEFFRANARAIWKKDRNAQNQFGFWWAGPFDAADAARQSSALDLLIGAEAIDAAGRACPSN
ncbi:MAG TPA: glycoside hydrolase family 76 protein [Terracidiphilus sp.]|nr:glycoside hydrolase family 76 protein [Terracidiphilus sp.]